MNERDVLAMLRERRALERIAASIRRQAALGSEWTYVLAAITDRLKWSAYGLSVAGPELVAHAAAVLNAEPDDSSRFTPEDWATAWQALH